MLRVVLLAGTGERAQALDRAMKLLGTKIIGYNSVEGYLVVRKLEADAIVGALKRYGIPAEARIIAPEQGGKN